ncbi:hypothetical protein FQA47_004366 [Oryzias melastigma]|uniref:Uncharacterized protein n=1 Tax=Oryzias melastigma TaxID=30732 RepID=A0A834FJ35_ORYME|nr:hypothetical protein FQA47_004366 [Oryzias melastigma]
MPRPLLPEHPPTPLSEEVLVTVGAARPLGGGAIPMMAQSVNAIELVGHRGGYAVPVGRGVVFRVHSEVVCVCVWGGDGVSD